MNLIEELRDILIFKLDILDVTIVRLISKYWLKYIPKGKKKYRLNPIVIEAARKGYLDILKWAVKNDCYLGAYTCAYAAKGGRLDVPKWLRENNCPWNKWTCAYAASGGHMDVLKWARENGCGWDKWVVFCAAKNGHLDILQAAKANNCKWDKDACDVAAAYDI